MPGVTCEIVKDPDEEKVVASVRSKQWQLYDGLCSVRAQTSLDGIHCCRAHVNAIEFSI